MNVTAIDHVNLKIPHDEIETAIEFYQGVLGFEPENLDQYNDGQRSLFSFRLSETNLIHIRPVTDFEEPSGHNFDHVALRIEESIEEVIEKFEEGGIEIERQSEPLGATGVAPAVYVRDPFGYLIEIKESN